MAHTRWWRWKCKWLTLVLIALVSSTFLPGTVVNAAPLAGDACYQYTDSDTLNGARYTALALAKRKAIETFTPFQEATANINDPVLLREIITNIFVRGLEKMKVEQESEDPTKKEVCRTITAEADGDNIKSIIRMVERAYQFRNGNQETGLPGNGKIQVVAAQESACKDGARCLYLVVYCQRNTFGRREVVRITWYDTNGLPTYAAKERVLCELPGDLATFWLRMPARGQIFKLDVPIQN